MEQVDHHGVVAGGLLIGPGSDPASRSRDDRPLRLEQMEFPEFPRPEVRPKRSRKAGPIEYKVVALRDCPLPERLHLCDMPEKAVEYWRLHVATLPSFNPEVETMAVLHLNVRRRVRGHHVVATGTIDTLLVHSREVFRPAIVASSAAVILMHNHPSGESTPSEADIRVTRDLIRAGQLLKIEVVDHVIVGAGQFSSLKAMGYFWG